MSESEQPVYILPAALIGRADLSRLVREVETLDNDLEAQRARGRTGGQTAYRMPNVSQGLSDFLEANKIDIASDQQRMALKERMRVLKDKAPVIHMTFATTADPESLQKLAGWMRQEIHPQALLSVGLQPSLVGGVYLRTPNHVHDFSVRQLLAGKREYIMRELETLVNTIPVAPAPGEADAR